MMNVPKAHVIRMLIVQIQSDLSLVPVIPATMETALIVQISMNVSSHHVIRMLTVMIMKGRLTALVIKVFPVMDFLA